MLLRTGLVLPVVLAMAHVPSVRCEPLKPEVDIPSRAQQLAAPLPSGAVGRLGIPVDRDQRAVVNEIVFSPDGKLLAALRNGVVRLWDVKAGKEVVLAGLADPLDPDTRVRDRDPVVSIAFSPDGKTLASASMWSSTIRLWNVATGKESATLTGHQNSVLAFAPDGKTLAACSVWFCYGRCGDLSGGDRKLRLWDVSSREELWQVAEVASHSVGFSADGKTLVAVRQNASICLWHLATGKQRLELRPTRGSVGSVLVSPTVDSW